MLRDRTYLSDLIHIGLPIALGNFISSGLNTVGVMFIGQLGEIPVAAVGLGNQISFLHGLMLFGVGSGSAIFTAQYWGSKDTSNIQKIVSLCLAFSFAAGLLFTIIGFFFPEAALRLYTDDPAVIRLGSQYLRIFSWSFIATSITYGYSLQLRAVGMVRLPTITSVVFLSLGAFLTYLLIFGKMGFPEMGVEGAALGTTIARLAECIVLVGFTHAKRLPVRLRFSALGEITSQYLKHYLVTVMPVFINETVWSIGMAIYNSVYAHISTQSVAAINITSTVENMAFVLFIGLANASAVMIGNRIGAGEEDKARLYARRTIILGISGAILVGLFILLISQPVLSLYKVSPEVQEYSRNILIALAAILWIKVSNMNIVVGILRAGGDTRFSMVMDISTVWLVGIPMALLGAFVLHLPVYWVYVMVAADEVTKLFLGIHRYKSGKWVNNLASV